ncbi:MAG: tetratricopeptide repeat protein [Spirochaetes bacterium]|nr:tetratricopeptide repeat protein [Spirochaetota bacterium]
MTEVDINVRIRKFLSSALRDIGAGNYDGAIEHLRAAEVLDPENPETLFNLGISYCRKEMFLEAIDLFSKVIALPRSSVDILTVLKLISYCLVRLESYEQALVHAGEGLSLMPDDTVLLNLAGFANEKLDRVPQALAHYRKILEIDPDNANARNSLAYIMAWTGTDLSAALEHAKAALKASPENPAYLDTLGVVYLKKGNPDQARQHLKKALSLMPESREIKNHINMLLKIQGK